MKTFFLLVLFGLFCPAIHAHPGVGIVMDSQGNVYYTDLTHVWKINPLTREKSVAVKNVHTHELYLDAQDNLYGENLWYEGERTNKWGHRVWCLRPDGTRVTIIPATQGFLTNYSFVRDKTGTMYWADRSAKTVIRKRLPDGTIGTHATGPFADVRWMTCTPDGILYLTDGPDVKRILPDGKVQILARNVRENRLTKPPVGNQHALMGLSYDPAGNVYVAVFGGRKVKKISPTGQVTVVAQSASPWSPAGVLADKTGNLWLLEYSAANQARVRRIYPDGSDTVY
ncbi:hypothetical protein GCM10023189_12220 [Nibrella saemangeumensis]|uniref:SMP-30/Gluconolactonase/LRE-like region domain-containing protein n=1 Tax=Nibrella saemangeumensis TaxID=1084526 RepID=A0ABP8MLB3_9BACT